MELGDMAVSALFSLVVLFLLTKLIGCRQVSQLSLFDYINGITIGSMASDLATAQAPDRLRPLVAMLVFGGAAFLLSFLTDRSLAARRVVEGQPVVLLAHGKLYRENFRHARIDLGEFLMKARVAGYFDLSQLQTAILEPNGMVSFLPYAQHRPATPGDLSLPIAPEEMPAAVILDGVLCENTLRRLGFDRTWLSRELQRQKLGPVQTVFLALCTTDGVLTVYPRLKNEEKKNK